MEHIHIQTSQNVVIEQPLASIGERILAHLLDYLFFAGYIILALIIKTIVSGGLAVFILLLMPLLFYDLICEITMEGQNWGKKIMKIKVVKIDGSDLNFLSCLTRWVFRIVDNIILFGGISSTVIIIGGKGQRLGDIVANTTVVRLKDNTIKDTLFTELPENYQIKYPEAIHLQSSDIYTVKEVLEYCSKKQYTGDAVRIAFAAKESLENKLMIKTDMVPKLFLETVIKDYNALHK